MDERVMGSLWITVARRLQAVTKTTTVVCRGGALDRQAWWGRRLHMAVALLLLSLGVAACGQPVFMGLPTPTPAPVVLAPDEHAPVPRFGPLLSPPDIPVAGAAPDLTTMAVGALPAPVATPDGPVFDWRQTENFLILGTDHRASGDAWRTDTIIVVGLDRVLRRAAVLSIPRDLYLEVPNYGYNRINQVDYIGERILRTEGGGPALVSEVLSNTLGIATQHWVRVEMIGFQDMVDAVGGVTIRLDCPFYEPIFNLTSNSWDYFTLPAGEVHLNGEAAYWYVRLRLRESDIGRSERQRQFLWALREQALATNLLPRLPALWSAFQHTFATDLSLLEMVNLVRFGVTLDPVNVRSGGITLRELQSYTTERGASVLVIADQARVQAVVDGIWSAPAMVDARRQNEATCPPIPSGPPVIATETPPPTPTPPDTLAGEGIVPESEDVQGGG